MTKKEVIEAITLIVMSYPASFKDETTVQAMSEVWYRMFKDDNPKLVALAVQKHISTSKWPPSIAEVREQMVLLQRPDLVPPDIAWTMVSDSIYSKGCWIDNLDEMFPPLILRVIETIGWSTLCDMHRGQGAGYYNGQDKQTFMELYKPAYERERQKAMLPQGLKSDVEKAERILGAQTKKMLDNAYDRRKEQEKLYENMFRNPFSISETENTKMLGGQQYE